MARALVNARIAPLVAQYPAHEGSTKKPLTDDMFRITPRVWRKSGMNAREHKKTPPTLTAICRFHSSGVVSSIFLLTWIAALFTRMSQRAKLAAYEGL